MRPKLVTVFAGLCLAGAAAGLLGGCGSSTDASETESTSQSSAQQGGAGMMTEVFTEVLDGLVADDTITQTQADTVLEAITASAPQGGSGGQQGMTPPEGGAAPSAPSDGGSPPSAVPSGDGQSAPQGGGGDMSSMFSTALDELVADGTITAKQEKAILAAITDAMRQAAPPSGAGAGTQTTAPQTY